jgi:hypothetical protein
MTKKATILFTNHCIPTTFSTFPYMEQANVNPDIGSILDEQKLKNIVYPARLFRARLNEEFQRSNRTRKPFLFLKVLRPPI